jgi:hypothetical protein
MQFQQKLQNNSRSLKTQLFLIIMDAITAEALARTTADGLKTQLFPNNTDAISAETLARTTADFPKHSYFTILDAITAEAN